ncbi:hypothetical protein [Serratia ureilytica]|uniref:hypothetical protein n=1 Tax=Serratia ureilytica TaxID=300181 RepID=UPI00313C5DFC
MAKVIFEFTESEADSTSVPGRFSVPVCIAVGIEGYNAARPGHAECLAVIMKKKAPAIIRAINEVYVAKLKVSGADFVGSELIKVNLQ